MSSYLPHTDADRGRMLAALGVGSTETLFEDIPEELRLSEPEGLPAPLDEDRLVSRLTELAERNRHLGGLPSFLGAGIYDHFIPSVVDSVASRGEFYTAYTPYQPEISQGTLQAIFEYQSMICELTGMYVTNASMYDGASALAEAAFLSAGLKRRNKVLVAQTVHPEYRAVTCTYARFRNLEVEEIGHQGGRIDPDDLAARLGDDVAAVLVQSPNFLGVVEDVAELAEQAHAAGAFLVTSADPLSMALFEPPGRLGADIVTGEGQALGNPASYGGPHFGFLAATKRFLRKMPGRIVGQTTDRDNLRGFVLTLQAREQHIRRERATSNICTNQALCALMGAVYMAALGKEGLKEVARLCYHKAHYAMEGLLARGFTRPFDGPFFKEFAVVAPEPVDALNARLLEQGILGGYDLYGDYPELGSGWLVAVTERRSREEIDRFLSLAGGEKR